MTNYQWYPGHMTKARRMMQEDLKLVDLVIELADARIPLSSRNPDIDGLCKGKSRILLLCKADLADPEVTADFCRYFEGQGISAVPLDARTRAANGTIRTRVEEACRDRIERDRRRGIVGRPLRAMVAGIPNVGKSTFINSFAGRAGAKTGNKPGVTRGRQWIRMDRKLELLDTPGILWPKFEDPQVGVRLALTGAIREELLNEEELAQTLLGFLRENYPQLLRERYLADVPGEEIPGNLQELLQLIAVRRSLLRAGGLPDELRTARILLDELRSGKIGRISLETPPERKEAC